jgi:hypothetical protein
VEKERLKPVEGTNRTIRKRLHLRGEVLLVLLMVEVLSEQRLLFASLLGVARCADGPGYDAAALAMVLTILLMILSDAVHPRAVSTAPSFALRAGDESNVLLFALAVG